MRAGFQVSIEGAGRAATGHTAGAGGGEGACTLQVPANEDSLLRTALRSGLAWPYECSVGGCGSCRYELLEGTVHELWPEAPGLSARERQRGRRLACQTRPASDLRVRVRLGEPEAGVPPPQRMQAQLVAVRPLTADLSEFSFSTREPARFLPGQYALLQLPGVAGLRAYSMSNVPNAKGEWQFIVKHLPGGRGSGALFTQVRLGDVLALDGPFGHAWLRTPLQRELVCVAGGSGLGPMLSIVRAALAREDAVAVHLFIGLRSQADLGALQALEGLKGPRLNVTTVLSQPQALPAWTGATGFVHEALASALAGPLAGPIDRRDFYLAGPPPMVEAVQGLLLLQHKLHPSQLRFDRFQ